MEAKLGLLVVVAFSIEFVAHKADPSNNPFCCPPSTVIRVRISLLLLLLLLLLQSRLLAL
jgi:hypothetical protein